MVSTCVKVFVSWNEVLFFWSSLGKVEAMLLKVEQQDYANWCGNKEMNEPDRSEDEDSDDNSEDTSTSESEKNNLWPEEEKATSLINLRQFLSCKLKKNPINKTKTPLQDNPVSNLLRKLTCGSSKSSNISVTASTTSTTSTTSPVPSNRKSMAYRRCLRIKPSQARHLSSSSHPTLGQVFAPELLQRNSSPILPENTNNVTKNTSSPTPSEELDKKFGQIPKISEKNEEKQHQTVAPSVDNYKQPSTFWAVRLYNSFRKPKSKRNMSKNNNNHLQGYPNPGRKLNYSRESPVKFLELPAQSQPLIHRYGVSQFVLLVDWNDAECKNSNFSVTASHPLRSVMRKPQEMKNQRKKCVKFQDSVSLYSNGSTSV